MKSGAAAEGLQCFCIWCKRAACSHKSYKEILNYIYITCLPSLMATINDSAVTLTWTLVHREVFGWLDRLAVTFQLCFDASATVKASFSTYVRLCQPVFGTIFLFEEFKLQKLDYRDWPLTWCLFLSMPLGSDPFPKWIHPPPDNLGKF